MCASFLGLPGNEQNPGWKGRLVTDDFSGYKACFELGVTEAGCMAHARRKFHELWANHGSQVGEQALKFFMQLYEVEREVQHARRPMSARRSGSNKSKPIADALHQWLTQQRQKVPDGSATARAIDYSLKRWAGADALHRRRRSADRQQLGREPDPADRHRAQQLAVRRQPARGQARRRGHEPGALGAAERPRALCVPARTCSSGCRRSRPAASRSCCRIAGSPAPPSPDRTARRQDGFAGRILWKCPRVRSRRQRCL